MAFRYRLIHHPSASNDFTEAVEFFDKIDPDLGALFREDFKGALRAIARGRPAGTLYAAGSNLRWIKLKRFSHKVYFSPEDEDVRFVLALVSGRRHPERIRRMLGKRKKKG